MHDIDLSDIDLSDIDFWMRPWNERGAAFRYLRSLEQPQFFREPELSYGPVGPGYFALVTYRDVIEASRNPAVFGSAEGAINIADLSEEFREVGANILQSDGPEHRRQRRILSSALSPRRIEKQLRGIRELCQDIVDRMPAVGTFDFAAAVGELPATVVCDLMGVPETERSAVKRNANIIGFGTDVDPSADSEEVAKQQLKAAQQNAAILLDIAERRRSNPRDDLTSVLVHANADGESLSGSDLGGLFLFLVVAGSATTRAAISLGMQFLTENPDQRTLLASDYDRYAPSAIDEIIRLSSPVNWFRRTLMTDYNLGSLSLRKGDKVILCYWSANRDEGQFSEPDRFDILRSPNPHLGFGGFGPHQCLGTHLARLEMLEMFRVIFERVPDLVTTGPGELGRAMGHNAVNHLPCSRDARRLTGDRAHTTNEVHDALPAHRQL
jgi:methyl-branched lipid omega-hydroxylase